jgi:hypothetical protein
MINNVPRWGKKIREKEIDNLIFLNDHCYSNKSLNLRTSMEIMCYTT